MAVCPNVNSIEWKALVAKIGVFESFREFIKHGETIPDAGNYQETFKGVNATLKIVDALTKIPRNSYPSNQIQGFYNDLIKFGAPKNQIDLLKQHIHSQGIKEINKTNLIASLLSEMSYTVEVATAKDKHFYEVYDNTRDWDLGDPRPDGKSNFDIINFHTGETILGFNTEQEAINKAKELNEANDNNSSYYSNLRVDGGINYTENEIRTPDITPSIKGHAKFSTDQGIGWFRSDDRQILKSEQDKENQFKEKGYVILAEEHTPKTRRILEIQSDLFQKGRDLKSLISDYISPQKFKIGGNLYEHSRDYNAQLGWAELLWFKNGIKIEENEYKKAFKEWENISSENQFLQLLNKDNNWVSFFVKSIIQDSAKKGYEKVLFPVGNTAAKVEGHETIEEFIKQRKKWISELEEERKSIENQSDFDIDSQVDKSDRLAQNENELNQYRKELEQAREGTLKISSIAKFYEDTIKNVLDKRGYSPIRIKDEHGNEWYQVDINDSRDRDTIFFQSTENQSSTANISTLRKVREWMKRAGIELKTVQNIVVNGEQIGANGAAKILEAVAEIVEGKENIALPEETMHFAVEIIKQTNDKLYKQLLGQIDKYNIYRSTLNTYKDIYKNKDGTANIQKIKEEAIAKLLVEQIIQQNEGLTEKPELLQNSRTWWENIVEWFKSLFSKAAFNPFKEVASSILSGDDIGKINNEAKPLAERILAKNFVDLYKSPMQQEFDSGNYVTTILSMFDQLKFGDFEDRTNRLLEGDTQLAEDIIEFGRKNRNSTYLQVTDEQQKILTNLNDKLSTFGITKVEAVNPEDEGESISYYQRMENGVAIKIKKRVTDFVKERKDKEIIAKFENATPIQKTRRKQQAKLGIAGHRDIESIVNAVLSPTGTLILLADVKLPTKSELKNEAYKALQDYLVGTEENPGILYQNTIFPAGTVFKTEQIIYDEKRDVAGTIDLLAVQPDGHISVLDWKFIFQNVEKFPDVSFFKQKDIHIQLGQYRQILGRYGVPYNNFHKLQAIPIHVAAFSDPQGNLTLNSITASNPNVREEKRRYLLPVAATDQSTGNETLDKYVKQLYGLHDAIYKKKGDPETKDIKIEQLNAISGAIRELQIKQEFAPLYQQANVFLKNAEALIEEYYDKFAGVDPHSDKISDVQINDFLSRINTMRENLPKYADLYSVFRAIYGDEDLIEEHQQLEDKLARLSGRATEYIKKIEHIYAGDKSYPGFVPVFIAQRLTNIKGLESPEKTVNTLSRDFSIQSLIQTAAMQAGGNIYSKAIQQATVDKQEALKEYESLVKKFNEDKQQWNQIIDTKENALIKKVNSDVYKQLDKATDPTKPDIKWLRENIDLEKYKSETAEHIKKQEAEIKKTVYPHESDEDLIKERLKKIKQLHDNLSIETDNSLGWYSERLRRYLIKEKFFTAEYIALQQHPSALALYEFMNNFNYFASGKGYHDGTRQTTTRFLPWVKASTYERLRTGEGIKAVYEGFQSIAKIHTDEEVYYGKQNPNTGEVLKSIPIFFTQKKDDAHYSEDVQRNFALYMNSVIDYGYASEVEEKLQAILEVEKAKGHLEVDNNNNIKVLEGGKLAEVPDNSRNAELFEGFINGTIYHERYSKNQILNPSQLKTVENINKYFRLKVFALNLITPFVNTFGGNLQATINAGKHWKAREFFKNELKVVQNHFRGDEGNIEKGLLDYFIPLNENVNHLEAKQLTQDVLKKWSLSEILMSPMRYTDKVIQLATGLTMLENSMIDDNNNIVNIREYVRRSSPNRYESQQDARQFSKTFNDRVKELKSTKSLLKAAKFNKEGEIELPNITRKSDTFINFRKQIQNEIKRINGSLSEEDRRNADRNIVQRSMMMFKNWIPLTVETRYGALKKNAATEEYQIGRTRAFWQILIHGFKGNKFKGLIQGMVDLRDMSAANTKGLKLLADYYKRTADSYYKSTGKTLEMSKEAFYDMIRQAISSQIRDNVMLMSLLSLIVFTKFHAPDDGDTDENKNLYRSTLRVLDKSMDEISFYYNPVSFKQIVGGTLIPSIGVLTDTINILSQTSKEAYGIMTDDETIQKNAHPLKAVLKMIPVASWMSSFVLPLINPEAANDLGIKVSSQNRY